MILYKPTGKFFIPFKSETGRPLFTGSEIVDHYDESGKRTGDNLQTLIDNYQCEYVIADKPLAENELETKTISGGKLINRPAAELLSKAKAAAKRRAQAAFNTALAHVPQHEDKAKRLALAALAAGEALPEYWTAWESACQSIDNQYQTAKARIEACKKPTDAENLEFNFEV